MTKNGASFHLASDLVRCRLIEKITPVLKVRPVSRAGLRVGMLSVGMSKSSVPRGELLDLSEWRNRYLHGSFLDPALVKESGRVVADSCAGERVIDQDESAYWANEESASTGHSYSTSANHYPLDYPDRTKFAHNSWSRIY